MNIYENNSKERLRFVRRATKNAWNISKKLDKIVDLSQRYNSDCQPEDVARIFETIEKSVVIAKERLTELHENAKG